MSDEADLEATAPASPAALRDTRWLSGAIWLGVLFALLLTSWAGLGADLTGVGLGGSIITYLTVALGGENDGTPEMLISFALLITAAIAGVLVYAWSRFAAATRQLIAGLAESTDDPDAASVASYWLPSAETGRSDLFDLVAALGVVWAIIVVRPVVLAAMRIYIDT